MAASSSSHPRARANTGPGAATVLLADPASRAIIGALGDAEPQALEATQLAATVDLPVTGRLVRDRLRLLERSRLVVATSRAATDGSEPTRWALTTPGRDLHRLLSLIARIAARAARLPEAAPSRAVEPVVACALAALADPIVLEIGRALAAADELEPLELEAACPNVPRRTLYRRLTPLVDAGVVIRETTRHVPRRTRYALAERWRPAVAIIVLTAWWEDRHRADWGPAGTFDLAGTVTAVTPTLRVRNAASDYLVRWTLTTPETPDDAVDVQIAGGTAAVIHEHEGATAVPDATIRGPQDAWTAALVEGHNDGLTFEGDQTRAEALLALFRASLLSYVR